METKAVRGREGGGERSGLGTLKRRLENLQDRQWSQLETETVFHCLSWDSLPVGAGASSHVLTGLLGLSFVRCPFLSTYRWVVCSLLGCTGPFTPSPHESFTCSVDCRWLLPVESLYVSKFPLLQ